MPQVIIIADDLTGAADTGAGFARAGLATLVALRPTQKLPAGDVLVLSTESRHLPREAAAERVRRAVAQITRYLGGDPPWIYKKVDSTLRGHPGPELAAVMEAMGLERALVAPAFPAQGRTTAGGRQLVDGAPLERTAFGREVHSSDLGALFDAGREAHPIRLVGLEVVRRGPAAVCEALGVPGPAVLVADAENEGDLDILVRAALTCEVRLLCGSAGLARALADSLAPAFPALAPALPPCPGGSILVVAGSRHPRTARQVAVARKHGAVLVCPAAALLGADNSQGSVERTIERIAGQLAEGRDVILSTLGLGHSPLGGQGVAARLAQVARGLAAGRQAGGLVLTGGDIAAAVCASLEAPALRLYGEVEPGVPWGVLVGGMLPHLPVVTKAGGFGTDAALVTAIRRLRTAKANPWYK